MKKLLIIVLAIFVIPVITAQVYKRAHHDKNMNPEEMAARKTKKMTEFLDLNQSQQDEVYKLNLENAKLRKAHMEERKAKKESGEMSKPSKEDRMKRMDNRLEQKTTMTAKLKEILNDEQFAKWEKHQGKRNNKMKEKMKKKRDHKKNKQE